MKFSADPTLLLAEVLASPSQEAGLIECWRCFYVAQRGARAAIDEIVALAASAPRPGSWRDTVQAKRAMRLLAIHARLDRKATEFLGQLRGELSRSAIGRSH